MSEQPAYRLSSIPGKGLGLVATRAITVGELIIAEAPIFTASTVAEVLQATSGLGTGDKATFLGLSDTYNPGKPSTIGIFRTNLIPTETDENPDLGGIFPTICRINHSCSPNAYWSWSQAKGRQLVHTMADIPAGEEIVVSYLRIPGARTRASRQDHFKAVFNFTCQCSACAGPADPARDARREKFKRLDGAITRPCASAIPWRRCAYSRSVCE